MKSSPVTNFYLQVVSLLRLCIYQGGDHETIFLSSIILMLSKVCDKTDFYREAKTINAFI